MRKTIGALALTVGLLIGGAATAFAGADDVCGPLTSGKIDTTGDPDTVTMTASPGHLIDSYCIKAGSVNNGNGPVYIGVDPPAASLTVGHPSGKAVSHYSWHEVPVYVPPSPTPSESDSPSPSPSASSSPSPSPSESDSPSPSPSPSESASPSPSPSESASPSPSPSASGSPSASVTPPQPQRTHNRVVPPTAHSTTSPPPTAEEYVPVSELAHTGGDAAVKYLGISLVLILIGAGAMVTSRRGAHL